MKRIKEALAGGWKFVYGNGFVSAEHLDGGRHTIAEICDRSLFFDVEEKKAVGQIFADVLNDEAALLIPKEVYCLQWITTGQLHSMAFVNEERAQRVADEANKKIKFWKKLLTHGKWVVMPIELR